MRFVFAIIVTSLSASLLAQTETPKLSDLIVAKARIVQLESQLAKLAADAAVCRAQQALSTQQQQDTTTKAAMRQIEKEAGCKVEWARVPVTCQDGK